MPGPRMTMPRLLLTRPRDSAERFAAMVRERVPDVEIVVSPLMEIVPLAVAPDLAGAAGVIFSSRHGVDFSAAGKGRIAHCVGQSTAEAAAASGWTIGTVAADAAGLIDALRDAAVTGPLVHLSGRHRRGEIADKLSQIGISTVSETIYDQKLLPLSPAAHNLLRGKRGVIVPVFSPRSARQFVAQAGHPASARFVAISPAVARDLAAEGSPPVLIADAPDGRAMLRAVEKLLRDGGLA